jgi:predicted ATPase
MMSASEPLVVMDQLLEPIVQQARSVAPGDRFADCSAMVEALENVARSRGLVATAAVVERWMLRKFPREHAASERELADLADAAEARDATRVAEPATAPTNLAPPVDGFVGRDDDLATLAERFAGGARLVTLLGPPGIGKTRLAREYAWRAREGRTGGAWFADLTEARSADGIVVDVATALGVANLDGTLDGAVRQLGAAIAHRGDALIVVDNFEQVVDHAAATLGRLADLAPSARWLVTSRERLNLPIEIAIELGPLDTGGETLSLLVERARVARPDIALGPGELDELASIAERLEGNPLAIELAAGRLKLLSPRQLRDRLASGFDVLTGRRRGVPERQTAFDKAIEWSWQMLEPFERDALAQAAIFRGGFSITAAESVIDLAAHPSAPPVIDVLESLGDKSLLRRIVAGELPDEPRFGMYEGIRSFARARLDGLPDGAAAAASARHADYFLAYAERWAATDRYPDVRERARHLAAERENIWLLVEPVLDGAGSPDAVARALRAVVTLVPIYEGRGLRSLFARVFDSVLDGDAAAGVPPRVLSIAWRERCRSVPRNQIEIAWRFLWRAFEIARDHGLREELAWTVLRGLPLTSDRRDPASREAMITAARDRFVGDDPDDRDWRALSTSLLISFQKVDDSDLSQLAAIVDDLTATAATSRRPGVLAHIYWALGIHHLVTGDLEAAQSHLRRVVALYEETDDDQPSLALARGNVAAMAINLDRDLDDALRLAELSRRSLLEMGLTTSVPFNDFNLALIREGLGDLDGAEVEARRCVERQAEAGPGSNWLMRGDTGVVTALAQLAIVQSQLGRADDADRTLGDAAARIAAWEVGVAPYSISVMEAARAVVDVARAQVALARGTVVAARRHLDAARARTEAAWSDEVMVIMRRVQRRLDNTASS